MRSTFKHPTETSEQDLMYLSHGTNFSINPEVPPEGQIIDLADIKNKLLTLNPKASKNSGTNT